MKTQDEIILEYLQNNKKGITQLECTRTFGFTRLSAIIYRLRKLEYSIKSVREKGISKTTGRKVSYDRYILEK